MSVLYCLMRFGRFGTFIIETYDIQCTAEQAFSSAVIKNALLFLGYHTKLSKRYLFNVLLQETHILYSRNGQLKTLQELFRFKKTFAFYVRIGTQQLYVCLGVYEDCRLIPLNSLV